MSIRLLISYGYLFFSCIISFLFVILGCLCKQLIKSIGPSSALLRWRFVWSFNYGSVWNQSFLSCWLYWSVSKMLKALNRIEPPLVFHFFSFTYFTVFVVFLIYFLINQSLWKWLCHGVSCISCSSGGLIFIFNFEENIVLSLKKCIMWGWLYHKSTTTSIFWNWLFWFWRQPFG